MASSSAFRSTVVSLLFLTLLTAFAVPRAQAAVILDPGSTQSLFGSPTDSAATPVPAPSSQGGSAGTQSQGGSVGSPAQTTSGGTGGELLVNPLKNIDSLRLLLKAVLGALLEIGTIVLILALIWVGFSFVRAQGNPKEIEKARAALIWTVIGGAILLGAQALADVIQSTVQNL